MIFPEIFEGHVMGFFTTCDLGTSLYGLTDRKVYMPTQEHTDIVMELDPEMTPKVADAVITDRLDVLLGVQTADCVPVLIFDTNRLAMGAVHAGWRGTARGILTKTIARLEERYGSRPEDLLIAIGPSVRECCYEVGADVVGAVSHATPGPQDEYIISKTSNTEKFHIDLQAANRLQAIASGVPEGKIETTRECTCCTPGKYHSFRRDKATAGRQGGFIGLP